MRLTAAAVFMGGGTATMHYIGMTALHASAHMTHAPLMVVASVAVGIAASGLALWLAGGRRRRPPLLLSATALGMAIAGMHYTAMAGLTLMPFDRPPPAAPALSTDLLAIVVAIVAFIVSGIFLLALVPDRSRGAGKAAVNERPGSLDEDALAGDPDAPPGTITAGDGAAVGLGTFGPLGGAGGPPRRIAKHLPVERDGGTHFVPIDEVVAVHANAHYTYVFDGKAKLFCPLAIGVVESRLDATRFIRVHRSHIVNIDRIVGLKRVGETGVIELAAQDPPYTVPVSRGRLAWLKSRLASATGETRPAYPVEPSFAAQHR
jgi:hypothetical protein